MNNGAEPPSVYFEVTGNPRVLADVLGAAHKGSAVVLVGVQKQLPSDSLKDVTLKELTLVGTIAHVLATDLPAAVQLLEARADGWADMAPTVVPLQELVDMALIPLVDGSAQNVKTLISMSSEHVRAAEHTLASQI